MTLTNLFDSKTGAIRMDQYWSVPHYKELLNIFQCLQVLDVVFSALKFTNNNVMTTLIQVFSRVFVALAIFPIIAKPTTPNAPNTVGVFLCMMNWSMIEVIRFGFYASKALTGTKD